MKFLKAVGAIDSHEVTGIIVCANASNDHKVLILGSETIDHISEPFFQRNFLFLDNSEILSAIKKESQEGPFRFIVLFFIE